MTLEASLILPVVFLVIAFLMYLGIYMYDDCVLTQDNYRMLIRIQQMRGIEDEKIKVNFDEIENRWYYDKYVSLEKIPKELALTNGDIKITQKGNVLGPNLIPFQINEGSWEIKKEVHGNRIQVIRYLRDFRKATGN